MSIETAVSSFDLLKEKHFAEQEVVGLFQQFFSSYLAAAESSAGAAEIYLRTARQTVRLRFAEKHLMGPLTRALLHLRIHPVSKPDLTICVWDTQSSKQNLPPVLEQLIDFINSNPNSGLRAIRGDIPLLTKTTIRTALTGRNSLTMADSLEKVCVHWISDAAEIPYHEVGAPLRVPFTFMFGSASCQLLHGGAVGRDEGGVFLGGVGGSGKSTTALNCLTSELFYASDDYVLVDVATQPTAFSLYNTAKVKTISDLDRFPHFRSWIANEDGVNVNQEKPMIFLNENIPEKLIGEIPLKAILFPRFAPGAKIRYRPMSRQCAFREIVTSTIRQTPNDNPPAIAMIGRFVKELPCYELAFGEDQADLPQYITEIISKNS